MTTTVRVTDSAGHQTIQTINLNVTSQTPKKIIGMSAASGVWSQRLSEVGSNGIRARRIFGDLTSAGNDQASLIAQAVNANMMPVVSYKVPSVANAINGSYDAWATAAGNHLNSYGVTVAFTIWHEPRGDMTGAQFLQLHKRLVPLIKAGRANLKSGPILNGWMLTGSTTVQNEFKTFIDAAALNMWDWMGIDTYQPGTEANPGSMHPGERVPPLVNLMNTMGHPTKPLLIGEYNGYTADAIADAGETFLSTPTLWVACFWNSQVEGGLGVPLEPGTDRMAAFKATKADSRALQ